MDDDETAVLAANQRFYDAHERRDLPAMRRVWADDRGVVCIHPGWPILRGIDEVMASWERILTGPGRNQFILTNVSVSIAGDIAWVTLDENLVDGPATGTVAATNLYRRTRTTWKLVHHHGSPVMG